MAATAAAVAAVATAVTAATVAAVTAGASAAVTEGLESGGLECGVGREDGVAMWGRMGFYLGDHIRITPEILQIAQAFKVKIIEAPLNPRSIIWGPPPVGWIKSNSDGSLSDDRGGYRALLRDCSAQFIIGSAGCIALPSINLLELQGLVAGLQLGLQRGEKKIWFETDSTTVMAWVKGRGNLPWTALRLTRTLVQGLSQLEEWRITHIFREGNSPTNILASRRQSRGEDFILPHQVWPKLKETLEANKAGTTFTRN
ncbi:hypothetical protein QJS10_CPA09g00979 [Acorus calamus]|uniref:RNase H type-1 domain-containing protein n=1 Tax=Acorus calamus TaxID=4465 RepID=A0AAV9E436_ACOCL|nr:hypothetical protein QJS10_CPA09g00979 [Acorus calamus]